MKLSTLKTRLMKDPQFKKEYNKESIKSDISRLVLVTRTRAGLTQKALAKATGMKQEAICRIESTGVCSLKSLQKIANAFGLKLEVRFVNI